MAEEQRSRLFETPRHLVPGRTNPATLWGGVLVDELARQGLRRAVISPGSRSTPLALAFASHPDVEDLVVIDERSAAFVALGIARASGRPAAVLCTSGTAAANFHPAVLEADRDTVPLLVLTADRPAALRDAGDSQAVDQLHLYGRAVRWFQELPEPAMDETRLAALRSSVGLAWARSLGCGGPPGAVHLNVPLAKPLEPSGGRLETTSEMPTSEMPGTASTETPGTGGNAHISGSHAARGRPGGAPWNRWHRAQGTPEPGAVEHLAGRLLEAERPLVLIGALGHAPPDRRHLRRGLAEVLDQLPVPVWAEGPSGVRFGDEWSGERSVFGTASLVLGSEGFRRRARPDLVLRLGAAPLDWPLRRFARELAADPSIEQWTVSAAGRRTDPELGTHWSIEAHPALLLEALARRLASARDHRAGPPASRRAWLDLHRRADAAARDALAENLGDPDAPVFEGLVVARLVEHLGGDGWDGALVVSSSLPLRDLEAFAPAGADCLEIFANRGANGIDGVVSTAVGIARVRSGGRTALAIGDVAFAHDLSGALALGRLGDDLTVVVLDNGGGAIFDHLPTRRVLEEAGEDATFDRLFSTPPGLDLEATARAAGLAWTEASTRSELETALVEGLGDRRAPGPRLVRVRVDREVARARRQAVLDTVARAVERALGEAIPSRPAEVPGTDSGASSEAPGTRIGTRVETEETTRKPGGSEMPGTSGTVVFLHGFTGSGAEWEPLAGRLDGWTTVTPDLPGHGTAPVLDPELAHTPAVAFQTTVQAVVDDVRRRLLGRQDPIHLVGYSLGARVALAWAMAAAEGALPEAPELASLVLVGASPGLPEADRHRRLQADRRLADELLRQGLAPFVDRWRALPLFAGEARRGSGYLLAAREERIASGSARGWAASLLHAGRGCQPDLSARLAAIEIPTLLVAGSEDPKHEDLARSMAECLPRARMEVVSGAGHAVHREAPERFVRLLEDHLARLAP